MSSATDITEEAPCDEKSAVEHYIDRSCPDLEPPSTDEEIDDYFRSKLSSRLWSRDTAIRAYRSMARCSLCDLCRAPDVGFVKVASRGAVEPAILVVGEAPDYDESVKGQAFVGKDAKHFDKLIETAGITPDQIRFTYTTRCFPHDERKRSVEPSLSNHTVRCIPFLWDEIEQLQPDVILTVGKTPTAAILGGCASITKMNAQSHKTTIREKEYWVVPCVAPSADLRSPDKYRDDIIVALKRALEIHLDTKPPVVTHILNSTGEAVGYLKELLAKYESGEITKVAYDLEYDVLVAQSSRSESNRLSTLDLYNDEKRLVAASFAHAMDEGYCIPLDHIDSRVDYDVVIAEMGKVLEKIPVIVHNFLKAEGAWTQQKVGITPILHADTMLESYALNMKTRSHGLKGLCQDEFGWPDWSRELEAYLLTLPPEDRSYKNVPLKILGEYAAVDPVGSWALHERFLPQIETYKVGPSVQLLHDLSTRLLGVESRGAYLDMELLERIDKEYDEERSGTLGLIHSLDKVKEYEGEVDKVYNPNSAQQFGDVLYGKFGAPIKKLTGNKKGSVADARSACLSDLEAGQTVVHETLTSIEALEEDSKNANIWIGNPEGQENSERAKIIAIAHDYTELKSPLRYSHEKPVELVYGSPSTDEEVVIDLIKSMKCKVCSAPEYEGEVSGCTSCEGTGLRSGRKSVHDFLQLSRHYKKVSKSISSYVQSLPKFLVPGTNRLVYNYVLHGTYTGRLASKDASLMTLPAASDIRRLFVSEWKDQGGLIMSIDQSQLEMRVLASYSEDPDLLGVYLTCTHCGHLGTVHDKNICTQCGKNLGDDLHTIVATQAFQKPREEISKTMRRYAKSVGFGVVYGSGPEGIADTTGLSVEEAQTLIDNFYNGFPSLKNWMGQQTDIYHQQGWVYGASGRKLYMSDYGIASDKKKYSDISKGERQSVNYPIQSAASDLTLQGMMLAIDELKRQGMKSRAWEFTHDSIEFDVYPGEFMRVFKIAKDCLENKAVEKCAWMKAPLLAEAEIGVRWDGSLAITEFGDDWLEVEGRKSFLEETCHALKKTYPKVEMEILSEKETQAAEDLTPRQAYKGKVDPILVTARLKGLEE